MGVQGKGPLRLLVAGLLLFASVAAFGQATRDELIDYWRRTPLRLQHALAMISDEACRQSEKTFLGCFYAIRTLASRNDLTIVPESGHLVLKEEEKSQKVEDESIIKIFEREKAARLNLQNEVISLFYSPARNELSFQAIAQELLRDSHPGNEEAIAAASMINAFLRFAYDPHTSIEPTELSEKRLHSSGSEYSGVGMNIHKKGGLLILSPMEGSPAVKAGIKNNDILTHVDGNSIEGKELSDVVAKILGKSGTTVSLQILRNGRPLEFEIVRSKVQVKNMTQKIVSLPNYKAGHIRLRTFMYDQACADVRAAIKSLKNENVSGLILDLRGNGGGLLTQAVCIASLFIPRNSLVTILKSVDGSEVQYVLRTNNHPITNLPLTILMDATSASASELLAGALQDHKRAWIVGERSFGKGTAQSVGDFIPKLFGKSVTLSMTTSVFYQPSGRSNQIYGIIPDFAVPIKPNATEEELFRMREADYYERVIANEPTEWRSNRSRELQDLQARLSGIADKLYRDDQVGTYGDYQLLRAAEVLYHDRGTKLKIARLSSNRGMLLLPTLRPVAKLDAWPTTITATFANHSFKRATMN